MCGTSTPLSPRLMARGSSSARPITDGSSGSLTAIELPGAGELGLYELVFRSLGGPAEDAAPSFRLLPRRTPPSPGARLRPPSAQCPPAAAAGSSPQVPGHSASVDSRFRRRPRGARAIDLSHHLTALDAGGRDGCLRGDRGDPDSGSPLANAELGTREAPWPSRPKAAVHWRGSKRPTCSTASAFPFGRNLARRSAAKSTRSATPCDHGRQGGASTTPSARPIGFAEIHEPQ
jgi:hypothetical protein